MGEITDSVKELNYPKILMDKGEKLAKSLFGSSVNELAGSFTDSLRLRRFKNQIDILEKAEKHIKERGLNPKNIDLKILAPLVNFISLEENPELQEIWAKLITNIVTIEGRTLLKQNSLDIISKISNEEVKILNYIYEEFLIRREEKFKKWQKSPRLSKMKTKIEEFKINEFSFSLHKIGKDNSIDRFDLDLMISNLIVLGVIKWEVTVDVDSAEKSDTDPDDTSLDIDISVDSNNAIELTHLGFEFILLCKLEEE